MTFPASITSSTWPRRLTAAADFDRAAREAFGLDEVHRLEDLAQRFLDLGAVAEDVGRFEHARIATRRIERDRLIAAAAGERIEPCGWGALADDEYVRVTEADVFALQASLEEKRCELLDRPDRPPEPRHERVARAQATLYEASRNGRLLRATMRPDAATTSTRPHSATRSRPRRRRTTGRSSRGSPREEDEPDLERPEAAS